jgi:hypothetical protein
MYDSYGAYGMLAAYNAGPGRYQEWRDRGRPLPAETRAYVAKIAPILQSDNTATVVASAPTVQPQRIAWTQSRLFAARTAAAEATPSADIGKDAAAAPPAPLRPHGGLFVPVSGNRDQ